MVYSHSAGAQPTTLDPRPFMATRSTRKAPVMDAPDESTPTTDPSTVLDESTLSDPSTVPAPEAPVLSDKEREAIEKRKAYSKARRDKIRAAQEAAGLILKREYRTADGAVFTNKADAAKHIATLAFREYVQANPFAPEIEGYGAVPIPADALAAWIVGNRDHLLPFLRGVGAAA